MAQDRWNHRNCFAPRALAQLPTDAAGNIDWGPVRVAHLDTGYTRHNVFGAWTAAGRNAIVEAPGRDFFRPQRPSAEDPLTPPGIGQRPGHGLKTGSVLSGRSADGSFLGIAPGLPLVPYRVNDNVLVDDRCCRAIARALDHVIAQRRCRVANISLGFPLVANQAMGAAVDRAYARGIIICAAAGQVINRVTYPAKHRRTIGVGGFTKAGAIYHRYDRYSRIDTWAPARPIDRAQPTGPDDYGRSDGTSYATVHVAAAAAIWLRFHGSQIDSRYGDSWRRVEAFRVALRRSQRALPFSATGLPGNTAGRLDIANLLATALPDPAALLEEPDLAADDLA